MTNNVIKNTKKDSERKSEKDIKIFLKKKKFKGEKCLKIYKNLADKEKEKGVTRIFLNKKDKRWLGMEEIFI